MFLPYQNHHEEFKALQEFTKELENKIQAVQSKNEILEERIKIMESKNSERENDFKDGESEIDLEKSISVLKSTTEKLDHNIVANHNHHSDRFEQLRKYCVSTNIHLRACEAKVSSLEATLASTSAPSNLYTPPSTSKKKSTNYQEDF